MRLSGGVMDGANALMTLALRNRLTVLAYHGVDDPTAFERQIGYLATRRSPISLPDLEAHLAGTQTLPDRAVLVTFDDGSRSLLEIGLPILERYGVPAIAFVITDLIDTDQPFWWDEVVDLCGRGGSSELGTSSGIEAVRALKLVSDTKRREVIEQLRQTATSPAARVPQLTAEDLRELEARGVAVASHTATHPCLDQCDSGVANEELTRSKERLEILLGHPVTAFAYPNGNTSPAVRGAVAAAGYGTVFLFDHRWCSKALDRMTISRVRVDSTTPMPRFEMLVSGLHPLLHRLRGRR